MTRRNQAVNCLFVLAGSAVCPHRIFLNLLEGVGVLTAVYVEGPAEPRRFHTR